MLTPCICLHLTDIHILFKLAVHSAHGLNSTCSKPKLGKHLVHSCLKKYFVAREVLKNWSLIMALSLSQPLTGFPTNIIFITFTFEHTIPEPMELLSALIIPFTILLSKPAMATSPSGRDLHITSFGLTGS